MRRAAALALLAAGCATQNVSRARVDLPMPLGDACLASVVSTSTGVAGFREMPEDAGPSWAFQLDEPNLGTPEPPELVLTQQPADESAYALVLEATFASRRGYGVVGREVVLQREREILSRAVERCTGRALTFGPERSCGTGEPGTVCIDGRLGAPVGNR